MSETNNNENNKPPLVKTTPETVSSDHVIFLAHRVHNQMGFKSTDLHKDCDVVAHELTDSIAKLNRILEGGLGIPLSKMTPELIRMHLMTPEHFCSLLKDFSNSALLATRIWMEAIIAAQVKNDAKLAQMINNPEMIKRLDEKLASSEGFRKSVSDYYNKLVDHLDEVDTVSSKYIAGVNNVEMLMYVEDELATRSVTLKERTLSLLIQDDLRRVAESNDPVTTATLGTTLQNMSEQAEASILKDTSMSEEAKKMALDMTKMLGLIGEALTNDYSQEWLHRQTDKTLISLYKNALTNRHVLNRLVQYKNEKLQKEGLPPDDTHPLDTEKPRVERHLESLVAVMQAKKIPLPPAPNTKKLDRMLDKMLREGGIEGILEGGSNIGAMMSGGPDGDDDDDEYNDDDDDGEAWKRADD